MKKKISGLPEKWAIRQNSAHRVCDWFSKYNATSNANLAGSYVYLEYDNINDYPSYEDYVNPGVTEIDISDFDKYVLNIEPEEVEPKTSEPTYEIY